MLPMMIMVRMLILQEEQQFSKGSILEWGGIWNTGVPERPPCDITDQAIGDFFFEDLLKQMQLYVNRLNWLLINQN